MLPACSRLPRPQRGEVLEHLIFQLVAVDHEEDGGLVRPGRTEKLFRRLDHGEGLTAALGVPYEATGPHRIEGAADGLFHRAGLVLAQDVFVQFLVLLGKDDVVLQESEHLRNGAEALHLGLQAAGNVNGGADLLVRLFCFDMAGWKTRPSTNSPFFKRAFTGFSRIYSPTLKKCLSLRIKRSQYSSCQRDPFLPIRLLISRAVNPFHDFRISCSVCVPSGRNNA